MKKLEILLKRLFDYQRFECNRELDSIICETNKKYLNSSSEKVHLSDEQLFAIAAGKNNYDSSNLNSSKIYSSLINNEKKKDD